MFSSVFAGISTLSSHLEITKDRFEIYRNLAFQNSSNFFNKNDSAQFFMGQPAYVSYNYFFFVFMQFKFWKYDTIFFSLFEGFTFSEYVLLLYQ